MIFKNFLIFYIIFGSFFGYFCQNLTLNIYEWCQKVPKNDQNCMTLFFCAKNILNSLRINYELLNTILGCYNHDYQKFCDFSPYFLLIFCSFWPKFERQFFKAVPKSAKTWSKLHEIFFLDEKHSKLPLNQLWTPYHNPRLL